MKFTLIVLLVAATAFSNNCRLLGMDRLRQTGVQSNCVSNLTTRIDPKNRKGLNKWKSSFSLGIPDEDDSLFLFKTALYWETLGDFRNALDTMRLYVELHPFAVYGMGEVLTAIGSTLGETARLPKLTNNDYILEYNWLVKIYPANPDRYYRAEVIHTLASTLDAMGDYNGAANMWYNYSLMFPDTESVGLAWERIRSIRNYQKEIPEDTTAFYVLTFPPKPLAAVSTPAKVESSIEMHIVPNPSQRSSEVTVVSGKSSQINVGLFDILGRQVQNIYNGWLVEGENKYTIDLNTIPSGTYYVRVQYQNGVSIRQLVIER